MEKSYQRDVKRHLCPFTETAGISRHPAPRGGSEFVTRDFFRPPGSRRTGLSNMSDISWFCDACADRFLTLASGDGWQAANHGPIFGSRPIAFFGYLKRHRVGSRLGARAHYSTFNLFLFLKLDHTSAKAHLVQTIAVPG